MKAYWAHYAGVDLLRARDLTTEMRSIPKTDDFA